jgi:hypothetical protein
MFSGVLERDSPSVLAALKRAKIDSSSVAEIARRYSAAAHAGRVEEPDHTKRTPGTSFNPRPARLILIALKELQPTGDEIERQLLVELLLLLADPPVVASTLESKLAQTAAAIVEIDHLRHLHLSHAQELPTSVLTPSQVLALPDRLRIVLEQARRNAEMLTR